MSSITDESDDAGELGDDQGDGRGLDAQGGLEGTGGGGMRRDRFCRFCCHGGSPLVGQGANGLSFHWSPPLSSVIKLSMEMRPSRPVSPMVQFEDLLCPWPASLLLPLSRTQLDLT